MNFAVQSATPTPAPSAVFAPFGTGGFVTGVLTDFSGNPFFLYTNGLQVDRSYVSGSSLSASAKLSGTFLSRGITQGTATTQFTLDGISNTLIVQAEAVPEPTGLAMVALGCLAMASRRWRRVGQKTAA